MSDFTPLAQDSGIGHRLEKLQERLGIGMPLVVMLLGADTASGEQTDGPIARAGVVSEIVPISKYWKAVFLGGRLDDWAPARRALQQRPEFQQPSRGVVQIIGIERSTPRKRPTASFDEA